MEWFTIHLDDTVTLTTMSNSCSSFLTKKGMLTFIMLCQDTLISYIYLSPKHLNAGLSSFGVGHV